MGDRWSGSGRAWALRARTWRWACLLSSTRSAAAPRAAPRGEHSVDDYSDIPQIGCGALCLSTPRHAVHVSYPFAHVQHPSLPMVLHGVVPSTTGAHSPGSKGKAQVAPRTRRLISLNKALSLPLSCAVVGARFAATSALHFRSSTRGRRPKL